MNIVYFILGAKYPIHMQVAYSIRSILAQAKGEDHIYIATETPAMFDGLPQTTIVPVSREDIKEWEGPHRFFWRSKIVVMQKIAEMASDAPMLYLDGDTILHGDFNEMKRKLGEGVGMMHLDEGCPGYMKGKSGEMWANVNGKPYGGITIGWDHHMWNAGVVAIPADKVKAVISKALEVCDDMLDDGTEPITVEQYSLSIAMHQLCSGMEEAKKWILHYWHYKSYWSLYIARFFVQSYHVGRTLDEEIAEIGKTNIKKVHFMLRTKRTLRKITGMKY